MVRLELLKVQGDSSGLSTIQLKFSDCLLEQISRIYYFFLGKALENFPCGVLNWIKEKFSSSSF